MSSAKGTSTYVPHIIKAATRSTRQLARRVQWQASMHRTFRSRDPGSLNEKILYKMAFDRRPILKTFADKLASREYARGRCSNVGFPNALCVIGGIDELDISAIPERCVIKPSHGSGAVILVDDRAPMDARLDPSRSSAFWTGARRVRRQQLNTPEFRSIVRSWLKAQYSPVAQWAYWGIPRRVIVEEYLEVEGEVPPDYRFWCFNRRPAFIMVDKGRLADITRACFDPDWLPLAAHFDGKSWPEVTPRRPSNLERMLGIAADLSQDIDFVRVDLYDLGDRIVFGELTNYPEGGTGGMYPEELFTALAESWQPHTLYGPRSLNR